MSIKEITTEELRSMKDREGIVFQGCGEDLQEWLDGVNDTFTKQGILLNGTKFEEASSFNCGGLTCLLFEFKKDMQINLGKLAIWRLQTHEVFGGTWLSDYVPNKLGGFIGYEHEGKQPEKAKPDCALIGQNGNVFNLVGIASRTLKDNGLSEEAEEMSKRALSAGDYYKAIGIIEEYVNITSGEEDIDEGMGMTM